MLLRPCLDHLVGVQQSLYARRCYVRLTRTDRDRIAAACVTHRDSIFAISCRHDPKRHLSRPAMGEFY